MNNMKKYRKQRNLTLKQLSKITNISIGYLCHLENGSRSNPSMSIMNKISVALNKKVEEIFFD